MTRLPTLSASLLAGAAIALAGCDRGTPPSGAANTANDASAPASQSTSSTLGTSPPPNDGTLPRGTTGSTGSRRGGGKS